MPNDLKMIPVTPLVKVTGKNTAMIVSDIATTESATWAVPAGRDPRVSPVPSGGNIFSAHDNRVVDHRPTDTDSASSETGDRDANRLIARRCRS